MNRFHAVALVSGLASFAAAAQSLDGGAAVSSDAGGGSTSFDAATAVASFDALWKTRDSSESLAAFGALSTEALQKAPNDYDVLWRVARMKWWFADGEANAVKKRDLGKAGWDLAEKALKVKPGGGEAHYYVALNIGAFSQAVGVFKALTMGLEPKFLDNLEAARKVNQAFDRHGFSTAKGRYWWELPWPMRNLGNAKEELGNALRAQPEHLRVMVYLADVFLTDGDAKKAKEYNDAVLAGSVDYDPPEGRRMKAWAKAQATKIAEALK